MKKDAIERRDREAAEAAYNDARAAYDQIIAECAPDSAAGSAMPLAGLPSGAIVLDADSPQVFRTAAWQKMPGTPIAFEAAPGKGEERFRWTFESLKRARYAVYVWIPESPGADRSKVALYTFSGDSPAERISVDQTATAGSWHQVGERWLSPTGYLELSNDGAGVPVAGPVAVVKK